MKFRRKVMDDLRSWKDNDQGTTAALIEGARRVGKTTVVEAFAREHYRTSIVLDFSKEPKSILDLFEDGSDLDKFFRTLQLLKHVTLYERDSVIVFDEVQLFPLARQMIKQLVEDHRYDYIETGSLISLQKNVKNIRLPSEEHTIKMYPMDFEEWLWANGDETSVKMLREFFESREPLGFHAHKAMMEKYRTYMVVGGMPQSVDEFLKSNNLMAVERRKGEIIELYKRDMRKMSETQYENAIALFEGIPSLLSSRSKRFSPGKVMKGSRSRSFTKPIIWLNDAMISLPCYRCNDPSVTVNLTADRSACKLYLLDTGLLFTLAFGSRSPKLNEAIEAIIGGKLSINEGMFFENSVAQQLRSLGYDLFFYTFEAGKSNYEIDFLIPGRKGIIPLEAKSSQSSSHKSLDLFRQRYSSQTEGSYVIHTKDLRVGDDGVVYIPIYMAMFLDYGSMARARD